MRDESMMHGFAWEPCFPSHILQRGYEYFLEGLVLDLQQVDDGEYTAVVRGNSEYHVYIRMEGGVPTSQMSCTCPYAESGRACKHMAAVLFALEDQRALPVCPSMEEDTDALLATAAPEELRSFCREMITTDSKFQRAFVFWFTRQVSDADILSLKKQVSSLIRTYADLYEMGEYSWYLDESFAEIESFVTSEVDVMLNARMFDPAFRLICEISDCLNQYSGIFRDDVPSDISHLCQERWEYILTHNSDDVLEDAVFDWFSRQMFRSLLGGVMQACLWTYFQEDDTRRRSWVWLTRFWVWMQPLSWVMFPWTLTAGLSVKLI